MRVALTGGAGFIGTHLLRRLVSRRYEVLVVDSFSSHVSPRKYLEDMGVKVKELDVIDTGGLASALKGVDVLVHLAALVDVRESEEQPLRYARVNVLGTVSALEAARQAGVSRAVFASSAAVYGEPETLPISENHPLRPLSFYGSTKVMGEEACRYYALRGLDCVAMRFFNVYGEFNRKNVVYLFLRNIIAGKPVTVYGDGLQTRDFIYVGDVAAAVERALNASLTGFRVYNVASGGETSIRELLEIVSRVTGRSPSVSYMPGRRGEIRHSYADVTRARSELGWEPRVSLEEGVERVYNWIVNGEPLF